VAAPAGDGAVGPKSAGVPETRAHLRYGARLKPDERRLRLAPGVGEVGLASDGEGEPAQRQRTNAAPRVLDYHGCLLTVRSAIRAAAPGRTRALPGPAAATAPRDRGPSWRYRPWARGSPRDTCVYPPAASGAAPCRCHPGTAAPATRAPCCRCRAARAADL